MGDIRTGKQAFEAEETVVDEAQNDAEYVADAPANTGPEPELEARAKPGPPLSGGGTGKAKPESKFHG